MEISKINVNGTSYDIVDTVTSINGKTGAIGGSDINAVLSAAGFDLSGTSGKANVVSGSPENHLAKLTNDGDLADSGMIITVVTTLSGDDTIKTFTISA